MIAVLLFPGPDILYNPASWGELFIFNALCFCLNGHMDTTTQTYVPWGRTFEEYLRMFSLTDNELSGRILGCSDGPSAFNCELTQRGGDVVSIDSLYQLTSQQIRSLIDETFPEAMETFHRKKALFIWKNLQSVHKLGRMRLSAMNEFLSDLEWGKMEGRYLEGNLPAILILGLRN